MLKVHVDSPITLTIDDVLEGIANLDAHELEELTDKILALRAERRVASIPQDEAMLLEKINGGVSIEIRRRYAELMQKSLDESITHEEQQEYLSLINQVKLADAERMKYIVELAGLRQSSVDTVMDELGLRRHNYASRRQ